ncbi:hypothetical protein [Hoyosella subflava]|uniref:Uncharacterized protein n=1 Tax=Hoyosella subflava (strain DSM 45089 / JCM 17490 / NBRC 109087 / DQS3-9A1) TaxID=443218 RepID=F6EN20_HOYSD|nr:hypothetical protein [Hoyosella subflava]AEF39337.1 hypothetical protein AS9A_0885 [Hoyosella subflava DQS3-9A1]
MPDPDSARGGPRPQRERIVLSHRAGARPVRTRIELEEQTRVGEVLVAGLMRTQLGLALRLALLVIISVGVLPLAFWLVPGLATATVGGVQLAWLLLGAAIYPLLAGVGWVYVRQAERNEQQFSELVED